MNQVSGKGKERFKQSGHKKVRWADTCESYSASMVSVNQHIPTHQTPTTKMKTLSFPFRFLFSSTCPSTHPLPHPLSYSCVSDCVCAHNPPANQFQSFNNSNSFPAFQSTPISPQGCASSPATAGKSYRRRFSDPCRWLGTRYSYAPYSAFP